MTIELLSTLRRAGTRNIISLTLDLQRARVFAKDGRRERGGEKTGGGGQDALHVAEYKRASQKEKKTVDSSIQSLSV